MKPISRIDPTTNQLYFRGISATELASSSDFESVLYLLVHGSLPTTQQKEQLVCQMKEFRGFYKKDIQSLNAIVKNLDKLRDKHGLDLYETLLTFVTMCPIVVANQLAKSQNREAEKTQDEFGHAANFLWMVRGIMPMQTDVIDFQTSLILHMDDPDNPSLTALHQKLDDGDVSDALLAALSEHKGPLHHGAGTQAMIMFEDIQEPDNVREYLRNRLKSGQKIFGLGHRIYRGIDPRAVVLREMLERRTIKTCDEWILHVSDGVVREGKMLLLQHKGVHVFPNVDLYNAAIYFTFGFQPELNTSLFAVSRAAGWMAHILEYLKSQ